MWKVSWLYKKVHDFLVVPLYYNRVVIYITLSNIHAFSNNQLYNMKIS